jgi:tetratricopeptide (TPR) repeat protein
LLVALASSMDVSAGAISPEYEALIRLYARGNRVAAVRGLGQFRAADLDQQVKALQRAAKLGPPCPTCPDPLEGLPLKAAVMLHADRDAAERPPARGTEQPRVCPGEHARRAGQIAAIVAELDRPNDFARRFYLFMAQSSQWDFCLDAAAGWAKDGLARYPRDPVLLLAAGAIDEENATLGRPSAFRGSGGQWRTGVATAEAASQRRSRFLEARRFLSEVVAADPTSVEARVRLGRVQWRLGDDAAARVALEEAARLGGEAPIAYLAHLFLGQVWERSGRADEAIAEFTRALELDPQSQAAAIALSEALFSKGDVAGARRVLGAGLAHAGQRAARDPQWDYIASNASSAAALGQELRQETLE